MMKTTNLLIYQPHFCGSQIVVQAYFNRSKKILKHKVAEGVLSDNKAVCSCSFVYLHMISDMNDLSAL